MCKISHKTTNGDLKNPPKNAQKTLKTAKTRPKYLDKKQMQNDQKDFPNFPRNTLK